MPFRALQNGTVVVPAMIPDQEAVECPECQDVMYPRDGDGRARHFYHPSTDARTSCSIAATGESDTHARCVALAVAALTEQFGHQAAQCAPEVTLDVSDSGSEHSTRRADALLEFTTPNAFFGNGVIIEVQHRHHEKDIRTTTHDYLTAGYSVAWLSSQDFGTDQLDYSVVNDAFASKDAPGYSVRDYSARRFIECESYQYSGEHNWGTVPGYVLTCEEDYEICTSRPCTLRRQYDEDASEYVYNPESITTPDLPLRVLQNTLVVEYPSDFEEQLTQRYHDAVLEKALADRPEIDRCRGPKGFHEWGAAEAVWTNFADQPKIELQECQYCPVRLLTNLRGYADERTDIFFGGPPDPDLNLVTLEEKPERCQHRSHKEGAWFEYCPDCGETNP
ncbi:competence protein CoiA [Haladaptatus sp. NG-SE-30]